MAFYSPDLWSTLRDGWYIVEVRTGSDSDFPKIQKVLDGLKEEHIPYILRILSAHRTSEDMAETAQTFPETLLPPGIRGVIDISNLRTKFCIAAAGGSAHIAGMTASETQTPVIALPVKSSSSWLIDSSFSMINMPPGIPNGFVPNNDAGVMMSQKLYNLDLSSNYSGISFSSQVDLSHEDTQLLEFLWLHNDPKSPVKISLDNIFSNWAIQTGGIDIFVPCISEESNVAKKLSERIHREALYMWIQKEGSIKYKNAILYAAQIIGMFNPIVRKKLDEFREGLKLEVRSKEEAWFLDQMLSPAKKRLFESGLWPRDKAITLEKGLPELEDLWYELFYRWKNADLYLVPDSTPIQVLQVRSDRKSVFNMKLDLEIDGTGEVQTEISNVAAEFIKELGAETCYSPLPDNIPEHLRARSQLMELCSPVTVDIDGWETGVEFVVRNHLTGSLHDKYYALWKENPYGIDIPKDMKEWDKFENPIFTPTRKTKDDEELNAAEVEKQIPDEVKLVMSIFKAFTEFMHERWYILIDWKIELFKNSQWKVVFGDELFTPESCRFVKIEKYKEYLNQKADWKDVKLPSEGKQIIRDIWNKEWWQAMFEEFLTSNPDAETLKIAEIIGKETPWIVLKSYREILQAMKIKISS